MGVLILGVFFSGLLLFPIVNAVAVYKKHPGGILNIEQNRTKDPRYFGKSFSKMMRKELTDMREETVQLSRSEKVLLLKEPDFYSQVCEELVIADADIFAAPEQMTFYKEIYAKKHLCITGNTMLRSAYAEGNLILGNQTRVVRWADARGTTAVFDNCELGISVSSAVMLSVGKNCTFRRLYAPVIMLGQYPDSIPPERSKEQQRAYRLKVQREWQRNISYITDDMIDEDGVVPFTVICGENLVVTENIVIQGDIRASRGVHVSQGAVVCGNIFAEGDVLLDKNVWVLGNIFTQGSVELNDGSMVGREDSISSIIAKKDILVVKTATVFGYLGCEARGYVWPLQKEENGIRESRLTFLADRRPVEIACFESAEAFEEIGEQGYRHNHTIREAVIPEGVKEIKRSFFYDCPKLRKVTLPSTLTALGDYAFAQCAALEEINWEGLVHLEKIGGHAFEGCSSLKCADVPSSVKVIGNAAFFGCRRLITVSFGAQENITSMGTHVFIGCPLENGSGPAPEEAGSDEMPWEIPSCGGFILISYAGYPAEEKESEEPAVKVQEPVSKRSVRRQSILAGTAALCAVSILCMAGGRYIAYAQQLKEREAYQIPRVSLYRNQGLPEGEKLSERPETATNEYVFYQDRALKRFAAGKSEIGREAEILTDIGGMIPQGVRQHIMVAPLRIAFEESASDYVNGMEESINYFYSRLPASMNAIDLVPVLMPYKERYIYFRTVPQWTAEGAYYAAASFLEGLGKELPDLEYYEEFMFEDFAGTVFYQDRQDKGKSFEEIAKYNDRVYYYLLPGASNWADITKITSRGEAKQVTAPIISKSNSQTDQFIGGRFSHAVFKGTADNGKTILIAGDKNANIIAPYFMYGYEFIYLINSTYYDGEAEGFRNIFKDYEVEDFLFVEGADAFENPVHLHGLQEILESAAKEEGEVK